MRVHFGKPNKLNGEQKRSVRIDDWDLWDGSHTIASVAVPLIERYIELLDDPDKCCGSPLTDDEDVPSDLRRPKGFDDSMGAVDEHWHTRWRWIVGEMLFALRCSVDWEWDDQYYKGELKWELIPTDNPDFSEMKFDRSNWHVDVEGLEAAEKRLNNGLRLFGKYFRALWW